MALRTVRVPPTMADVFAEAEAVARYFSKQVQDPERGSIEISGDRYILVRAASLSVEFFGLVRKLYGEPATTMSGHPRSTLRGARSYGSRSRSPR